MNTNTSLPNPVREDGLVLDSIYIAIDLTSPLTVIIIRKSR